MASIYDLLRAVPYTQVVSRIAPESSALLYKFGMQPGGELEEFIGDGRWGRYHIFNNVRYTGRLTAPGTAAKRVAQAIVGHVDITYPRMHFEVPFLAEELHNLAKIDDPTKRDIAGEQYIRRQMLPIAQRAINHRTAMLVGMLRDSLYIVMSGDDWYFSYDSGSGPQVNFRMPAGNKDQLDMLGTGSIIDVPWDNPAADIPGHLLAINAAMKQTSGAALRHVLCNSAMWNYITNNDKVQASHGIANPPFQMFMRDLNPGPVGQDGKTVPVNIMNGKLLKAPNIDFWICDDGLDIGAPGSETYTKHFPDGYCSFLPEIDSNVFSMRLGSEPIREYDNGPEKVVSGVHSWGKGTFNPTGWEVFALDNCLPIYYVPAACSWGHVYGY